MAADQRRSFAEMNLAIFRGEDPGGVLWQPRLEFWYQANTARGTLPARYQDANLLDLYDDCRASVRYFTRPLRVRYHSVKQRTVWLDETHQAHYFETPIGTLREVRAYDSLRLSGARSEYRIKTLDDLRILEYVLQDEEWYWDAEAYARDLAEVCDRGAPQFYPRRTPVQGLFIEHMGFEPTIFALVDQRERIDRYVEIAGRADDAMYEMICACPVPIYNLGENIDANLDPPPIWREHLAPWYRKRTEQLRAAGKYTHIHVDGAMKPILGHMQDCAWDGIEAATPEPQGDVTLEEIKEALGDLVLLDGIPAIYFLPSFPESVLMECVERVVRLFHPRLVLGISDEIPPDGDIERVKRVGEMVAALG